MKRRILAAAPSVAVPALPASQSGAAEYRIDSAHSVVQFKISHLGQSIGRRVTVSLERS